MKSKHFALMAIIAVTCALAPTAAAEAKHNGNSCGRGNGAGFNGAWGRQPGAAFMNPAHTPAANFAYSNFPPYGNGIGYGPLARQARLDMQSQRIQQLLASGRLTPAQAEKMQRRLAKIQSKQLGVNGSLTANLAAERTRLEQLLSSGTLAPWQAIGVRNRLTQIQNQQALVTAGGVYPNSGLVNNLRGLLLGF